jgi:transposase
MTIIRIGVDTSKHLFQVHGVDEAEQPALALEMLGVLFAQVAAIGVKLKALEAELMAWHRSDPVSQCLATQPGIGPIGAVSFTLKVGDPKGFRSGVPLGAPLRRLARHPAQGARHRRTPASGRISRQGDEDLRRLLVLGATAVIRAARPGRASPWLLKLLARKPKKLAAVALANKMARTLWAMMVSGEVYRRPQAA